MAEQVPTEVDEFLSDARRSRWPPAAAQGRGPRPSPTSTTARTSTSGPGRARPPSGQIDENPTAAFAIDEYSEDWRQTKGVQGRGKVHVVQGEGIARWPTSSARSTPSCARVHERGHVLPHRPDALEFIDNSRGVQEGDDFGADYRRSRCSTCRRSTVDAR